MGKLAFVIVALFITLFGNADSETFENPSTHKQEIINKYKNAKPTKWGERLDGVISILPRGENVIALTLDLCGSRHDGLDDELVDFLIQNQIPATFFVNYRWIQRNPKKFENLYKNPLFEIENHGHKHLPASLNGKSAYSIQGTKNAQQLYDEVATNADLIEQITGIRPRFFRSGTAFYDELALQQIQDMGFKPVGFSVLGDAGATYSQSKVAREILKSKGGDIIICHANKPKSGTAKGLIDALPKLQAQGFKFVLLRDYL